MKIRSSAARFTFAVLSSLALVLGGATACQPQQGDELAPRRPTAPSSGKTADARKMGAVGDGLTDDGPALQRAIASLRPLGGTVVVPAGVYRISGGLRLGNDVTLRGVGAESRFVRADASFDLVTAAGVRNVVIRDLALVGDGPSTAGEFHGVHLVNCIRCEVRRLQISRQPGVGILANGGHNQDLVISGNHVFDNFGHGISFTAGTTRVLVEENIVEGLLGGGYGFVLGYEPTFSTGAVIRGNRAAGFSGGGGGFQLNWLRGAVFENNTGEGTDHFVVAFHLVDSVIRSNRGTRFRPTDSFRGALTLIDTRETAVEGNVITGVDGHGVYGIRVQRDSTANTIRDNEVMVADGLGVLIEGPDNPASGNRER